MYDAGNRTSFRIKGMKANNDKKNDNHNGINPIRKDTSITINITSKFGMSKKNIYIILSKNKKLKIFAKL